MAAQDRRRRTWTRRLLWAAIAAAMAWCIAALALDRMGQGLAPPAGPWDAIVVLGCGLDDDGRPSSALHARVVAAVGLYHAGVADRLVTTGGVGRGGLAEADAAAKLAIELGVPAASIDRERTSTSTEENAANTAAQLGVRDVVIVSDAYHITRASRVFSRHFGRVAAIGTTNPDTPLRAWGALREVAALAVYAVRGRL